MWLKMARSGFEFGKVWIAAWKTPKKLYTLEWKPPSVFVRPVVGEGLSTLPDFVQKSQRE
jgi:hypothetical protein